MPLSSAVLVGLLGWGVLVGVDLVSFPQALLSRPLIAAAGAGMILGDPVSGLEVGMAIELFALDVLPVGAARYPDYGAGAIGAVVLASGRPLDEVLGFAAFFALGFAMIGGWSLQVLRRANGSLVRRNAAGLAAGDPATIALIQYRGLAGDAMRSLLLTGLALATALLLRPVLPEGPRFVLVTAVAIGCGAAAALGGAVRTAGWGTRLRWLLVGSGAGLLLAVLR
jgi:mannose/fructose/N-acetylgalactosamine-specific phosphotransferase system component IIC